MNPFVRRILGYARFPQAVQPTLGPPVPTPYPVPGPNPPDWPTQTSVPIKARKE